MFGKKCCNPNKEDCSRKTLQEALDHAKERAAKTRKVQNTKLIDGIWLISTIKR